MEGSRLAYAFTSSNASAETVRSSSRPPYGVISCVRMVVFNFLCLDLVIFVNASRLVITHNAQTAVPSTLRQPENLLRRAMAGFCKFAISRRMTAHGSREKQHTTHGTIRRSEEH